MRKVKFIVFIPRELDSSFNQVDGTNKFSEPIEGVFHQWGLDSDEGASYTVGIVETSDGKIHLVLPRKIQFIDNNE